MEILTVKINDLGLGDILIIDMVDVVINKIPITFEGAEEDYLAMNEKCEGQTGIFLFEIDDIVKEWTNGKNNKEGTTYTFYHQDDGFEPVTAIVIDDQDDLDITIIKNPSPLPHYQAFRKLESELNL